MMTTIEKILSAEVIALKSKLKELELQVQDQHKRLLELEEFKKQVEEL